MQDREKERKKLVEQATSEEIKEAKKFRDQLLRIHQDKILNCTDDVNSDVDVYHMPGAFAESEVKFMKSYFGEICLEALKNNGAIVVRVQGNEKKNDQLFGVDVYKRQMYRYRKWRIYCCKDIFIKCL